jgi:uncharacterized membrane protein YebE (DUF533 family)
MKVNKIAVLIATLGVLAFAQAYADDEMPKHPHPEHGMMDADTNKDGKISHDEFMAANQKRSEEMFKRMDTNGDGVIDQAEKQAAFEKMREHRQEWRENHPKPDAPRPN